MPADQNQAALYDSVNPSNEFTFVPGVVVLPIAEDPPTDPVALAAWSPVVTLRLHSPYRIRRTSYKLMKSNNPPVTPAPISVGVFTFIGGTMQIDTVLNSSLSNYDWLVNTEYFYVESCVARVQDGLVLGGLPIQSSITQLNSQTYGQYSQSNNPPGALKKAGFQPLVGAQLAQQITSLTNPMGYGYNEPSYFPGIFFDTSLVNGDIGKQLPGPGGNSPPVA